MTELTVQEMSERLSGEYEARIRRKDIIMKLWLLEEDDDILIPDHQMWRLQWARNDSEVDD